MPPDPREYPTRWSMLENLRGADAAAAWSWFVDRYRAYISAVLVRVGLRRDEVEDALAEFWGYLFRTRAIDRADRDGRFRSFLAGVTRNYGLAWLRDQQPPAAPLKGDIAAPEERDQDLALWGEQILQLALARLEADHVDEAKAVRWFYGLGARIGEAGERLRGTEIAERLGCLPNAVHQLLFRARARLRNHVEAEVATTVGNSNDLRDELGLLLTALGSHRPGLLPADADQEPT